MKGKEPLSLLTPYLHHSIGLSAADIVPPASDQLGASVSEGYPSRVIRFLDDVAPLHLPEDWEISAWDRLAFLVVLASSCISYVPILSVGPCDQRISR